ncbi:MAG: cell division protein ZapB [Spirochaetaceae bacterium]|jgi:chromosome segregation ATPase|nr:cell division protein ZapB [Spirochaetaceae bacterium]
MVTLEQIKLLETKVARAIDVVTRVTGENAYLKGKLENYQKRIDELEVLIQRFKEDQGRIEDGILSALDRLNEFEAAMEKSIAPVKPAAGDSVQEKTTIMPEPMNPAPEDEETGDPLMFSVPEDSAFEDDDAGDDLPEEDIPDDDEKIPNDSDAPPGSGTAELDIF